MAQMSLKSLHLLGVNPFQLFYLPLLFLLQFFLSFFALSVLLLQFLVSFRLQGQQLGCLPLLQLAHHHAKI